MLCRKSAPQSIKVSKQSPQQKLQLATKKGRFYFPDKGDGTGEMFVSRLKGAL